MAITESVRSDSPGEPIDDEARVLERCRAPAGRGPDPRTTSPVEFLGRQFDLGLAWVHFPEGHGGLGPVAQAAEDDQRDARPRRRPAPAAMNPIGHGMGAPTVVTHGSDEQKRRYLRPLFTGEEIWCQLFCEPGAGSDVAGLVDPGGARRRRVDRQRPEGVDHPGPHVPVRDARRPHRPRCRPSTRGSPTSWSTCRRRASRCGRCYQITGEAEFNEVYFTDVRIPDAERLGDVGEGWRVSLTTLMNERVSIGGQIPPRGSGFAGELMKICTATGPHDAATRDRVMRLWIRAEVLRLTNIRASQNRSQGTPGPEGSIGKMAMAELQQGHQRVRRRPAGRRAACCSPAGYPMARPETTALWSNPQQAFLRSRANSIEGGTTEIMKNILGERVLGLPGDIRIDKDRPWIEVPRS